MSGYTVLLVNKDAKSTQELQEFFGQNLVSVGNLSTYDNFTTPEVVNDTSSIQDSELDQMFQKFGLRLETHKRGYLLKPSKKVTSSKLAKKYQVFQSSTLVKPLYWNKSLGGWVTSKQNKTVLESYLDESEVLPLANFTLCKYKRGLLLKDTKNTHEKTKYFHGGYWNETLSGWVFKSSHKSQLVQLGAVFYKVEKKIYASKKTVKKELSDYTFSSYKKGLLLKCKKKVASPEKYFHEGYWNETLKGWVYSKKHQQKLLGLGAIEV
jgi:hypothetical protein